MKKWNTLSSAEWRDGFVAGRVTLAQMGVGVGGPEDMAASGFIDEQTIQEAQRGEL